MLCLPDVRVANGSTGREAVVLLPGQSTKHPSFLSCRNFLMFDLGEEGSLTKRVYSRPYSSPLSLTMYTRKAHLFMLHSSAQEYAIPAAWWQRKLFTGRH